MISPTVAPATVWAAACFNSARPGGIKVTAGAVNAQCGRALDAAYLSDHAAHDRPDFDAILNAGASSLSAYHHLLRRGGRMMSTPVRTGCRSHCRRARRVHRLMVHHHRVRRIRRSGQIHPTVDRIDPLESLAEAHRAAETGPALAEGGDRRHTRLRGSGREGASPGDARVREIRRACCT
ncbi:zinc-binding dehydrogenase [Nonomuraea angiospora]|uniref:zinc-binding dehydrogenase n=1 Tax=Nonomuraea angiospora TaxID=46172 RepID=UPI00344FE2A9